MKHFQPRLVESAFYYALKGVIGLEYKILMANGDQLIDKYVSEADSVDKVDDVYVIRNAESDVIFTAPLNSVIYISQERK